jgi:hypothetical protein
MSPLISTPHGYFHPSRYDSEIPDRAQGKALYDLSNPEGMSYRVSSKSRSAKRKSKSRQPNNTNNASSTTNKSATFSSDPDLSMNGAREGIMHETQSPSQWKGEHQHMREMSSLYEQKERAVQEKNSLQTQLLERRDSANQSLLAQIETMRKERDDALAMLHQNGQELSRSRELQTLEGKFREQQKMLLQYQQIIQQQDDEVSANRIALEEAKAEAQQQFLTARKWKQEAEQLRQTLANVTIDCEVYKQQLGQLQHQNSNAAGASLHELQAMAEAAEQVAWEAKTAAERTKMENKRNVDEVEMYRAAADQASSSYIQHQHQ